MSLTECVFALFPISSLMWQIKGFIEAVIESSFLCLLSYFGLSFDKHLLRLFYPSL